MYKRYLVMMDEQYYPAAGTGSVVASFDSLDEAIAKAKTRSHGEYLSADYVEIFDCDKRKVVWEDDE